MGQDAPKAGERLRTVVPEPWSTPRGKRDRFCPHSGNRAKVSLERLFSTSFS